MGGFSPWPPRWSQNISSTCCSCGEFMKYSSEQGRSMRWIHAKAANRAQARTKGRDENFKESSGAVVDTVDKCLLHVRCVQRQKYVRMVQTLRSGNKKAKRKFIIK